MLTGARVALVVALVAVLAPGLAGSAPAAPPAAAEVAPGWAGDPDAVDSFRSTRTYDQVAEPARLRIPAAGVDTGLDRLSRVPDGSIAVPSRPDVAGWWAEGPRPGQLGPAVILGHVDSRTGPGVFYRLSRLPAGTAVFVDTVDGRTVAFRTTGTTRVPKARFPTELVYAPTLEPALRLVTCGGAFDRPTGHYEDNVIVYAVPS